MVTVFFTSTVLVINNALLKGRKSNQDDFVSSTLPWLMKEQQRFTRKKCCLPASHGKFCMSPSQNITAQLTRANTIRLRIHLTRPT
jgi:hypothetical protein